MMGQEKLLNVNDFIEENQFGEFKRLIKFDIYMEVEKDIMNTK